MVHKKIRLPRENADEILRSLGTIDNALEFVDLTHDDIEAKKTFISIINRCDLLLSKIMEFETICSNFHLPYIKNSTFQEFETNIDIDKKTREKIFGFSYFDLVESEILDNDRQMKELISSHTQMREDLLTLIEKKHVLVKTSELIQSDELMRNTFSQMSSYEEGVEYSSSGNLNLLSGVVKLEDEMRMKRMVFRISRGRAIMSFYDLNLESEEVVFISASQERGYSLSKKNLTNFMNSANIGGTKQRVEILDKKGRVTKKIFNIIFQGGESGVMLSKVMQVCDLFQVTRYGVPRGEDINLAVRNIENDIKEKKIVLVRMETNLQDTLKKALFYAPTKKMNRYSLYYLFLQQEKLIYTTLNKCLVRENFIDGEVWIPKKNLQKIRHKLQEVFEENENKITASLEDLEIPLGTSPPTFIPTNEFFWAFQEIVNSYGIPRYQEINPGYFNIVTFPFLFGVMFGDIGHGFIVLFFATYLCFFNDKIKKSRGIFKSALPVRYFLLFMGFFAFFCGWCYNDFLSIPIEMMTCFKTNESIRKRENCVYPIGIDPAWARATNELAFVNSLKMKLSVIFGVIHMSFGIILRGCNALFFKDYRDFVFIFIPQIVFMILLFGYMDALIVIKWVTPWGNQQISELPDIKSLLLDIFLSLGKVDFAIWGSKEQMRAYHLITLVIVFICVIVMLVPKPFLDYRDDCNKHLNRKKEIKSELESELIENIQSSNVNNKEKESEEEMPAFSNYMVHSVIETIEFVLGAISNTASYLRLWALSLAHSQLSKVAFQYGIIMAATFTKNPVVNGFFLSMTFIIFACLTVGVLLFMDLMECFLHTLRLHWVEFQDKFFKADGYAFVPFCFKSIISLQNK